MRSIAYLLSEAVTYSALLTSRFATILQRQKKNEIGRTRNREGAVA